MALCLSWSLQKLNGATKTRLFRHSNKVYEEPSSWLIIFVPRLHLSVRDYRIILVDWFVELRKMTVLAEYKRVGKDEGIDDDERY